MTHTLTRARAHHSKPYHPHLHAFASDQLANPRVCAYESAPPPCCRRGPSFRVMFGSSLSAATSCVRYMARLWGTGAHGAACQTSVCIAAPRRALTLARACAHHPKPYHPHSHALASGQIPVSPHKNQRRRHVAGAGQHFALCSVRVCRPP